MDHKASPPLAGRLRCLHTAAESYIQKVLPTDPNETPNGKLAHISIVTRISYSESGMPYLAEDETFDAVLTAVVKAEFPRLAMMALVRLDRAAKAAEADAALSKEMAE